MIPKLVEDVSYSLHRSAPSCLDLFSGAGGLSIGFSMAGGKPVGAVDNDLDSISTYSNIFPFVKDIVCCQIEDWRPSSRPGEIDVIIGGPPCQGFSLARGLRFADDPRNHLYKYFIEAVKYFKPKWIVMENVEGITNIGNGVILSQIVDDFTSIGYRLDYKVVNMAEYGVPQLRRRAIFVGNREDISFIWPQAFCYDSRKNMPHRDLFNERAVPYTSVNSMLSDLLLPQGNYFSHRANAQMRGPRNRNAHTDPAFTLRVRGDEFALCEKPATAAFIPGPAPEGEISVRTPQNHLQEMLRNSYPHWIKAKSRKTFRRKKLHTLKGTRRLTIIEQARLQTFPDWIVFHGKTTSQARQIGNAVPPFFAFQLFKAIFHFLR